MSRKVAQALAPLRSHHHVSQGLVQSECTYRVLNHIAAPGRQGEGRPMLNRARLNHKKARIPTVCR